MVIFIIVVAIGKYSSDMRTCSSGGGSGGRGRGGVFKIMAWGIFLAVKQRWSNVYNILSLLPGWWSRLVTKIVCLVTLG